MKFHSDLGLLDFDKLPQNVYDLNSAYFFVSLLPRELKLKFLSRLNPEARRAFTPILNVTEEFVSEEECDCIIFPPCSPYMGFVEYMDNHNHILSTTDKPVAVVYFSSDDSVYDVGEAIQLFRGGSYRSQNRDNVHGSLYVVADYYRGVLSPKELKVSFCGCSNNHGIREEVLSVFGEYEYFNPIHRNMWGGDDRKDGIDRDSYSIGPSDNNKREFVENMEGSLYSLVVRGKSNATYRFIESFMMGKIPLLIETDYMLPFADEIPYDTNMVIVPYGEDYDKALREFHNSHTEEELYNIQLENRSIWEKYFRADSAYYNVKSLLSRRML